MADKNESVMSLKPVLDEWKQRQGPKPNILICGGYHKEVEDKFMQFLHHVVASVEPHETVGCYFESPCAQVLLNDDCGTPNVYITATPVANFIQTYIDLPETKPRGDEWIQDNPPTMKDFISEFEMEIKKRNLKKGTTGKIDIVWLCVAPSFDEQIKDPDLDFIRSSKEIPDVRVMVLITDFISYRFREREDLTHDVDALCASAPDILDRIVVFDKTDPEEGLLHLFETTKLNFLKSNVFVFDEENPLKQAYLVAWEKHWGKLLAEWKKKKDGLLVKFVKAAAGHTLFIKEESKTENRSWSDMWEEGRSIFKDFCEIIKGNLDTVKDWIVKKYLANIGTLIYEVGGCCGQIATESDVKALLAVSDESALSVHAPEVTYAIGMTAKAYFESGKTLAGEDLGDIFRQAKEKGKTIHFRPFDYDGFNFYTSDGKEE